MVFSQFKYLMSGKFTKQNAYHAMSDLQIFENLLTISGFSRLCE